MRLSDDPIGAVLARRRIPELRRFGPPVRVIFGADDRHLNPRVADNSLIAVIQRRLYSSGMAVSTELDLGALARIGMALADATRRRVLVHLIGGTGYPAQMAEQFGTTRANLSNHLACLRECGLVTATAEGRRVRYALADDRLADGLRILAALDLPGCYE